MLGCDRLKKTNGFGLIWTIIIIIITAVVSSMATGVIMLNNTTINNEIDNSTNGNDKDLNDFINVYNTLITKYYDEIDKKSLLKAAEEGMLDFLEDKYIIILISFFDRLN